MQNSVSKALLPIVLVLVVLLGSNLQAAKSLDERIAESIAEQKQLEAEAEAERQRKEQAAADAEAKRKAEEAAAEKARQQAAEEKRQKELAEKHKAEEAAAKQKAEEKAVAEAKRKADAEKARKVAEAKAAKERKLQEAAQKKAEAERQRQAAIAADTEAWNTARRANTQAAYNGYLQNFASGKYVLEAQKRLESIIANFDEKVSPELQGTVEVIDSEAQMKVINDRYVDNGNGTITDKKTNLMWKKCPEGLSGVSCELGAVTRFSWKDDLGSFPKNSTFSGFNDWTVPTMNQLRSLVYCSNDPYRMNTWFWSASCNDRVVRSGALGYVSPSINQNAFPNTPSEYFFSRTKYQDYGYVSFKNGDEIFGVRSWKNPALLRLVRIAD